MTAMHLAHTCCQAVAGGMATVATRERSHANGRPPSAAQRAGCAGCDAFSVHLILGAVACSLNLGADWTAVAGSMMIMAPWALAHWEEYHCGTMLYGNGVWGLTEANYALCLLHFITAAVRPSQRRWSVLVWIGIGPAPDCALCLLHSIAAPRLSASALSSLGLTDATYALCLLHSVTAAVCPSQRKLRAAAPSTVSALRSPQQVMNQQHGRTANQRVC